MVSASGFSRRKAGIHAALVDGVLADLCARLALPANCALAAVGGYGRGELFPGSDVDVLLLLSGDPAPDAQAALEAWVQACWDVGLEIGHSVRSVETCLVEADADITVETNLLEARFVWGNAALFDAFGERFRARFDVQRFFDGKLAEQQAELAAARSAQVGTGERAEKIRTYNYPERRVTDHRVKVTVHNLDALLGGELDELTAALQDAEKRARLDAAATA